MHNNPQVLVVGTTPDYIDWIRKACPGRALFLSDTAAGDELQRFGPSAGGEVRCDLSDFGETYLALQRYLDKNGMRLDGVACYDCESMELAAYLAGALGLSYPSRQAVNNCRDKYLSKALWQKQGLYTPKVKQVRSADEAAIFFRELNGACVLKPLTGSGSELIFRCEDGQACRQGFQKIKQGLSKRCKDRLYQSFAPDDPVILAESFISGDEYSCDFIYEAGQVKLIRLTAKILAAHGPFGTTLGYRLPTELPAVVDKKNLLKTLALAAAALGIERAVCMLDFIIQGNRIVLLELAPRPGGDCLPALLRSCQGLDILKLMLDFSQQRSITFEFTPMMSLCIGLRLHARKSGVLRKIDTGKLDKDPRVVEVHLVRRSGQQINLPPESYDDWILGHVIFQPDASGPPRRQCEDLLEKVTVEIE